MVVVHAPMFLIAQRRQRQLYHPQSSSGRVVLPQLPCPALCFSVLQRAGDTLLEAVRRIQPGVAVGKVLIQRDETDPDKRPKLFYVK